MPTLTDSKVIEFLQQLVAETPWGQNLLILNKLTAPAARLYYLRATARFGWSRNVLLNQIKAGTYEEREPIEVCISKDELVILSYPGPDRSVRLEQLRAGRALPRRYRNRRIGEFLKELDMTEGRATGIPKILHAMKQNGSPTPEFDFDKDHTYFMCRLPIHPQSKSPVEDHRPESGGESGGESEIAQQILSILAIGPIGKAEIARELGKAKPNRYLNELMARLVLQGFLAYTIPSKPNSRLQKYRLTAKGKAYLAAPHT